MIYRCYSFREALDVYGLFASVINGLECAFPSCARHVISGLDDAPLAVSYGCAVVILRIFRCKLGMCYILTGCRSSVAGVLCVQGFRNALEL